MSPEEMFTLIQEYLVSIDTLNDINSTVSQIDKAQQVLDSSDYNYVEMLCALRNKVGIATFETSGSENVNEQILLTVDYYVPSSSGKPTFTRQITLLNDRIDDPKVVNMLLNDGAKVSKVIYRRGAESHYVSIGRKVDMVKLGFTDHLEERFRIIRDVVIKTSENKFNKVYGNYSGFHGHKYTLTAQLGRENGHPGLYHIPLSLVVDAMVK